MNIWVSFEINENSWGWQSRENDRVAGMAESRRCNGPDSVFISLERGGGVQVQWFYHLGGANIGKLPGGGGLLEPLQTENTPPQASCPPGFI